MAPIPHPPRPQFQRAAALIPGDGRPHYARRQGPRTQQQAPRRHRGISGRCPLLPKDVAPRLSLGIALLRADRAPEAEAQFREALALGGGPQASDGLAQALLRQDKNQEAIDAFATYLKSAPDDRQARFDRAVALQNLDRFDEALAELDRLEQSRRAHAGTR